MNDINTQFLEETVNRLLTKGKGILAADESNSTADKRLVSVGIDNPTEETRRQLRELLFTTNSIENQISGIILYDETFWQKTGTKVPFVEFLQNRGIVPGIKVDTGAKDFPGFPGEKLTVGLDNLAEKAKNYFDNGARFAKWRAVIQIDEEKGLPTPEAVEANADVLGRYARICQEAGLVPIVEPEVLLSGPHSIKISEEITFKVLVKVFEKLEEYRVYLPGTILKTSMVINGNKNPDEASPEEIADATVRMLLNVVPDNIGGVVFLSGGQTAVEATSNLDAIVAKEPLPFELAFSFSRALQMSALRIWQGNPDNVEVAQTEFKKRLELNQLADAGDYRTEMEYLD